jgi:hypothetical protein
VRQPRHGRSGRAEHVVRTLAPSSG